MKKIFSLIVATFVALSADAQYVNVYKGDSLLTTYKNVESVKFLPASAILINEDEETRNQDKICICGDASGNWVKAKYTTSQADRVVYSKRSPVPDEVIDMLCNKEGQKGWMLNTDGNYCWGNAGDSGVGSDFGSTLSKEVFWWGAKNPSDLLEHIADHAGSDVDNAKLYAQEGAYMVFDRDGTLSTYSANDSLLATATYNIVNYNRQRNDGWALAELDLSEPAVLWPYAFFRSGYQPTTFDIMYLDENNITLLYDEISYRGYWCEVTYWRLVHK